MRKHVIANKRGREERRDSSDSEDEHPPRKRAPQMNALLASSSSAPANVDPLPVHSEAVVSLSRRCDVMTEWSSKYFPAIKAGGIEWANPFNCAQRKIVSLVPFPGTTFWSFISTR
jgi:hypothetical protein